MPTPRSQASPPANKQPFRFPDDHVQKKVSHTAGAAASTGQFTIPLNSTATSPSGVVSTRPIARGIIWCATSNDSGVNEAEAFEPIDVKPGALIAVFVTGNVLTVSVDEKERFRSTGTALTFGSVNVIYG